MRPAMILTALLVVSLTVAGFAGQTSLAVTPAIAQAGMAAQEVAASDVAAQSSGLPERAAPARTMRAYWHVFVAFVITWALLFGFALSMGRRFGALEEEIRRLREDG
jgi:CcmD family protein